MSAKKQWINLDPIKHKGKDDEITDEHRLGYPRFEAEFKLDQPAMWKVTVEPVGDEAVYTDDEKARNPRFTRPPYGVLTNGSAAVCKPGEPIQLPAAGGNKYKITAKHRFKCVEGAAGEIETWRRLYYQAIAMRGLWVPDLDGLLKEYENDFLSFKKGAGTETIRHFTIRADSDNGKKQILQVAAGVYGLADFEPAALAIIFVDKIAYAEQFEVDMPYPLLPNLAYMTFTLPDDKGFWHTIRDEDDLENLELGLRAVWRGDAQARWIDENGKPWDIDDKYVSLVQISKNSKGLVNKILIEIPEEIRTAVPSIQGRLQFSPVIFKSWGGGYSEWFNCVIISHGHGDKEWIRSCVVHEVGHAIGFVPEGVKQYQLSKAADDHLYGGTWLTMGNPGIDQMGGVGAHCTGGIARDKWDPAKGYWEGTPDCVMFGSWAKEGDEYKSTPKTFCGKCRPLIKKLDLHGENILQFKTSIRSA